MNIQRNPKKYFLEPIKENAPLIISKSKIQLQKKKNHSFVDEILTTQKLNVHGYSQDPNQSDKEQTEPFVSRFRVETKRAKPKIMKVQKLSDVFNTSIKR